MSNVVKITEDYSANKNLDSEGKYSHLKTYYDSKYKVGWFLMQAQPRPCFTPQLLKEINDYQHDVKLQMASDIGNRYDFLVLGSNVDNVFNLGGDLSLFSSLIQQKDRDGLFTYAKQCINVLHQNMEHLNSELTTISLVQGDALGGGFEAALSSNVLIAERGTKLGLPEVLFNLFPGMGAYSLLSRKLNPAQAEKMIMSGRLYSAEELYEMGIVDILAEKGEGEFAVYKYIKSANHSLNSHRSMRKVKDLCNPIKYKELIDITTIWVDSALKLTSKDLRMMSLLVKKQNNKK